MRRDIKISVSRKNRDVFDIWNVMQMADPNPSSTAIRWIREGYKREWKQKVLSPPQQKPEPTIIKTKPRPIKEESEEQRHIRRDEAIRIIDAKITERSTFGEDINEKMKITVETQIKKLQDEKARLINS